ESVNIGTAGHFRLSEGSAAALEPLLTSSALAAPMPALRFQFLSDPRDLLNDFVPSDERYVLAARLSGPLETAFPGGPPGGEAGSDGGADGDSADGGAADGGAAEDEAADGGAADGESADSAAADGEQPRQGGEDVESEPGATHL